MGLNRLSVQVGINKEDERGEYQICANHPVPAAWGSNDLVGDVTPPRSIILQSNVGLETTEGGRATHIRDIVTLIRLEKPEGQNVVAIIQDSQGVEQRIEAVGDVLRGYMVMSLRVRRT